MDTSQLKDLAISDNGFVFDPNSGHTFTVNATGQFILRHLAAGTPISDLARIVADHFECGKRDDPARDALDFVGMLKDAGLVR